MLDLSKWTGRGTFKDAIMIVTRQKQKQKTEIKTWKAGKHCGKRDTTGYQHFFSQFIFNSFFFLVDKSG